MKIKETRTDFLEFLKPTKTLRHYLILEALAENAQITQRGISKIAGISPAVVNQYLAKFEEEGLIRKKRRSQRDYIYLLTEEGRRQRRELMVEYTRETFRLFSAGKDRLAEILQGYAKEYGLRRVIFYTAGEVTELLLHSLGMTDMELLAIVDDDPAKQGKKLLGYPIISREEIEHYSPDAVIITTFRYREGIYEKIKQLEQEGIRIIGF